LLAQKASTYTSLALAWCNMLSQNPLVLTVTQLQLVSSFSVILAVLASASTLISDLTVPTSIGKSIQQVPDFNVNIMQNYDKSIRNLG
jgi:hypothetical protein